MRYRETYSAMQRGPYDYRAFITGSHAYGTPTAESDVDLVVLAPAGVGDEVLTLLRPKSETKYEGVAQFVEGRLNLIMLDVAEFEAWFDATRWLIAHRPVTRERAVEVIKWRKGLM